MGYTGLLQIANIGPQPVENGPMDTHGWGFRNGPAGSPGSSLSSWSSRERERALCRHQLIGHVLDLHSRCASCKCSSQHDTPLARYVLDRNMCVCVCVLACREQGRQVDIQDRVCLFGSSRTQNWRRQGLRDLLLAILRTVAFALT